MKKYIPTETAVIAAAMAISLFISGIFAVYETKCHVEKNIVRLHILAATDSERDQQLKLKVRDAILACSDELFQPYSTAEEAELSLYEKRNKIEEIAERVLRANGSTDNVSCQLELISFDSRDYNNYTVPAGNYTALRVTIGSGNGKNWWCVMYPPLCVPCAAVDMTDEEIMEIYGGELTEDDIIMLTDNSDFKARLYIVDLIQQFMSAKDND